MLDIEEIVRLSNMPSINNLNSTKEKINNLKISNSELLDIADDMFRFGDKAHINSLHPITRAELGCQLTHMTERDPKVRREYTDLKNKYVSLGKGYASLSYLFDLIDSEISSLDLVLMHELLLDDGSYRKENIIIKRSEGEHLIIPFDNILVEIDKLFDWYNEVKSDHEISQTVLATLFHYYLLSIHPFTDGNGRISRIFLNLIILKNNSFPIVIPDTRRKEYYDSLINADLGNFENLINFIAELEQEKLENYLRIANDLSKIKPDINCLVLTEDGNTTMIQALLSFHSFNMDITMIESYDGKDNIAAAVFLAKKMKDKNSTVKQIIFHRDRDNYNPQQLDQIIKKSIKGHSLLDCSTVFITKYYDMESYFINSKHITSIFPEISLDRAEEIIQLATEEVSETSKRKLRIALDSTGRYGKIDDPEEKSNEINKLYDSDPEKYRYGKDVLYILEELITKEINSSEKITLVKKSPYIKVIEFEKVNSLLKGSH